MVSKTYQKTEHTPLMYSGEPRAQRSDWILRLVGWLLRGRKPHGVCLTYHPVLNSLNVANEKEDGHAPVR